MQRTHGSILMRNWFSMADSPRTLHLYTHYFPQVGYESFLLPELPHLAAAFDKVKIFPKMDVGRECLDIPPNVEVIFIESGGQKARMLDRLKVMGTNLFRQEYLKKARKEFSQVGQTLKMANSLAEYVVSHEEAIHYSYWFEEWSLILGELFSRGLIRGHITRAHGFDLYDERSPLGYHPYRRTQLRGLKKIFPVSNVGTEYLKKRIGSIPITTAYLGTEDHGLSPIPERAPLRILTIARVVPLKRLEDLTKVLALCRSAIHWTHIGDGPGMESLRDSASRLPKNITVEFKAKMIHQKVMQFLSENAFHALVSLSESEGLPVSMMEAISFGIPVLTTDVGGVKEIVNEETGLLVDAELDHENIAGILDEWNLTGLSTEQFRKGVRRYWEENFSAQANYPAFIEELKELHCAEKTR